MHSFECLEINTLYKVVNDLLKSDYPLISSSIPLFFDKFHVLQRHLKIKFFQNACKLYFRFLNDPNFIIFPNKIQNLPQMCHSLLIIDHILISRILHQNIFDQHLVEFFSCDYLFFDKNALIKTFL